MTIKLMAKYNIFNFNRDTSHLGFYPEQHFDDSQHPSHKKGHVHRGFLGHETRHRLLSHFSSHRRQSERRPGLAAEGAGGQRQSERRPSCVMEDENEDQGDNAV